MNGHRERLERLSHRLRVSFAAGCASRVLRIYEFDYSEENRSHHAEVDVAWKFASGESDRRVVISGGNKYEAVTGVIASRRKLPTESYKCLRRKLPKQYHEILDEIIGDLYACVFARAVDEAGSPFFERLLNIYQSGAWPCGWEGRCPEGKLALYAPVGEGQLRSKFRVWSIDF